MSKTQITVDEGEARSVIVAINTDVDTALEAHGYDPNRVKYDLDRE